MCKLLIKYFETCNMKRKCNGRIFIRYLNPLIMYLNLVLHFCWSELLPDFKLSPVSVSPWTPTINLCHDPTLIAGQVAGPTSTLPLGTGNLGVGTSVPVIKPIAFLWINENVEMTCKKQIFEFCNFCQNQLDLHFDDERVWGECFDGDFGRQE